MWREREGKSLGMCGANEKERVLACVVRTRRKESWHVWCERERKSLGMYGVNERERASWPVRHGTWTESEWAGSEPGCMRTTDKGGQPGHGYIHRYTTLAGEESMLNGSECRGGECASVEPGREEAAGPAAVSRTEGEMPAATSMIVRSMCSEKPGPPSQASWDHSLVASAH